MRDFRDSKVMAHALRDALKAKAVDITHSESLELIAATFGFANWNILSAKIEAAGPRANDERQSSPVGAQDLARPKTLHCSFCGKSQHEVRKLIAGPSASYICNECAELCVNISNEEVSFAKIFGPLRPDEGKGDAASVTSLQLARRASSEELEGVLERGKRVVTSRTRALQGIEQRLAMRADEDWRGDELLALPELAYLRDKSREDLLSIQQATRVELERYEEGLRIAATILAERGEQVR